MRPSEALAMNRECVVGILDDFRAVDPKVFGSAVRGEDVDGCDLDIVSELDSSSSYDDIFRVEDA
jgi:uncharacterized protein